MPSHVDIDAINALQYRKMPHDEGYWTSYEDDHFQHLCHVADAGRTAERRRVNAINGTAIQ